MKLMNQYRTDNALPNASIVCDVLMRLDQPFHVMAWIMAESAARISDLQSLRVRDVNREKKTVLIEEGTAVRTMNLSDGLVEAVEKYLCSLRESFEKNKRWKYSSGHATTRDVQMFADQLLFPAWILHGHDCASLNEPISVAEFVRALQNAATEAGFGGHIQSHTLRLFCTSRWLEQGMDVAALHINLGHRDIMTTMLMVQALKYGGLKFASSTETSDSWNSASMVA